MISLRTTRTCKIMGDAWLVIVQRLFHSINVIRNALTLIGDFTMVKSVHNILPRFYTLTKMSCQATSFEKTLYSILVALEIITSPG